MFNLAVGSTYERDGRDWILTRPGVTGHAIYGPYERFSPGSYRVTFELAVSEDTPGLPEAVCAFADVVSAGGRRTLASAFVFVADADRGSTFLDFELDSEEELEFRLHVNGRFSLLVADSPKVGSSDDVRMLHPLPSLLKERIDLLKHFYDNGTEIDLNGEGLILSLQGIRFVAREYDDVNFVDELFFKSAYNFKTRRDTCVIDIGMNVALASLLFAAKPEVKEIYAFEPFPATFARGLANIALNPALASKIRTNNFGLADKDEDGTLLINDNHGDSGGMQTRSVEGGTPMQLTLRNTASTLRPIIADAKARGLDVVAKIDCEGSEFPIFESLVAGDVLKEISALMVEWHRIFMGRTQDELIEPLLDAGFTVFDLTPPEGNGFFYAVRSSSADITASRRPA